MKGDEPVGVILAGGRGRRLGGAKLTVLLRGRPLVAYPLEAMQRALHDVALITKPDTELPQLPRGTAVWLEPAEPRHPLVGIVEALALADGRPVVTCPADLPFVTPELLRRLAAASPAGRDAERALATVVSGPDGRLQPLLARYESAAAARLAPAAREGRAPVTGVVLKALTPAVIEVADSGILFNVNDPSDLIVAEAMLAAASTSRR